MRGLRKVAAFIAAQWRRLAAMTVGITFSQVTDWFFNNPLYIYVIATFGPLMGGVVMTILSTIVCLGYLWFYNRTSQDWFGLDAIEALRDRGSDWSARLRARREVAGARRLWWVVLYLPAQFFALVVYLLRKGDVAAFFVLCILMDPFTVTAYLRHGRRGEMTRRDWWIFLFAIVVSNGYWIFRTTAVLELLVRPVLTRAGIML